MRYHEINEARLPRSTEPRVQPDVWQTPEFKAWFGNSKVANPDGSPRICIHAASQAIPPVFDPSKQRFGVGGYGFYFTDVEGANRYSKLHDRMLQIATAINQIPVFLKIENPLVVKYIEHLKPWLETKQTFGAMRGYVGNDTADILTKIQRAGYDGVITTETLKPRISKHGMAHARPPTLPSDTNWLFAAPFWQHAVYIVFASNQIKSIWNKGTFDPTSGHISETLTPL